MHNITYHYYMIQTFLMQCKTSRRQTKTWMSWIGYQSFQVFNECAYLIMCRTVMITYVLIRTMSMALIVCLRVWIDFHNISFTNFCTLAIKSISILVHLNSLSLQIVEIRFNLCHNKIKNFLRMWPLNYVKICLNTCIIECGSFRSIYVVNLCLAYKKITQLCLSL